MLAESALHTKSSFCFQNDLIIYLIRVDDSLAKRFQHTHTHTHTHTRARARAPFLSTRCVAAIGTLAAIGVFKGRFGLVLHGTRHAEPGAAAAAARGATSLSDAPRDAAVPMFNDESVCALLAEALREIQKGQGATVHAARHADAAVTSGAEPADDAVLRRIRKWSKGT